MKVKSLVVTMPPLNYTLPNKKITVSNMGTILLSQSRESIRPFLQTIQNTIVAVGLDCTPETEDKALLQMTPYVLVTGLEGIHLSIL